MKNQYQGGLQAPSEMGFKNMPVRFFITDESGDFIECDEAEFIEAPGVITYDRYTVFDNGVRQICLTKNQTGA